MGVLASGKDYEAARQGELFYKLPVPVGDEEAQFGDEEAQIQQVENGDREVVAFIPKSSALTRRIWVPIGEGRYPLRRST
jgi:hypothetical protein